MATKKNFQFQTESTKSNQKAVKALTEKDQPRKLKRATDPEPVPAIEYPSQVQKAEPLDGQISLFDEAPVLHIDRPFRKKNGERRTQTKQFCITPTAKATLKAWAERNGTSYNEAITYMISVTLAKKLCPRRISHEKKSVRLLILLTPTMEKNFDEYIDSLGYSQNDFMNSLLENAEIFEA